MTDEGNITDAELEALAEALAVQLLVAIYASPAPSYADAIRDCLGAVEAAREKAIHSRSVDYVNGVREGHARSIRAIRALTPGSPL